MKISEAPAVGNTFPSVVSDHRVALVGEAPGSEELRHGAPFVGPSGKVLNMLLRTAGIDRDTLFVGNAYPWKAPGNDVGPWMKSKEITEYAEDVLREDLLRFRPNVIVPVGSTALWFFTGETAITRYRGAVHKATRVLPGTKLVPTFHPQFIQRQWKQYVVASGDLEKAWREGTYPDVRWPKRRLMVEPTLQEALAWIDRCYGSDLLSVDIETGWGLITCIGLGVGPEAMCIPFVDLRQADRSYWRNAGDEAQVWYALRGLLGARRVQKLGQNFAGYDAHWLNDNGLPTYGYSEDTMLLHHALYGELEKSLAFMAARYTNTPAWKAWTNHQHKTEKRDDTD